MGESEEFQRTNPPPRDILAVQSGKQERAADTRETRGAARLHPLVPTPERT